MKSNKYWENRAAMRMYGYMANAEQTAAEIERAYLQAAKELEDEMKHIFSTFQDGLTEVQARKLLKNVERVDFNALEKLYKKLPAGPEKDAILKKLNAPAYRARIARLQTVQDSLEKKIKELFKVENKANTGLYRDLTKEAYYRTTYDLQKGTSIGYSFTDIGKQRIDSIMSAGWSGQNYSSRIWNNTEALAESVKRELLIGLMSGKSQQKMAKVIEEQFATSAFNARRLVRTEANYVANQAEAESYADAGIERYRFVATLDNKTSPMCRKLDGRVFHLSERKTGVNYPPIHPWCRSTTIAEFDTEIMANLRRRARDPETGKTYTVPANMTYADWKKGLTKRNRKVYLGSGSSDPGEQPRPRKIGNIEPGKIDSFIKKRESRIVKLPYEKTYFVTANGEVYVNTGTAKNVGLDGVNLAGAIITHNHPPDELGMADSFGKNDFEFLQAHEDIAELHAVTEEYEYRVSVLKELDLSWQDVEHGGAGISIEKGNYDELQHNSMEWLRQKGYVKYVRRHRNEQ